MGTSKTSFSAGSGESWPIYSPKNSSSTLIPGGQGGLIRRRAKEALGVEIMAGRLGENVF